LFTILVQNLLLQLSGNKKKKLIASYKKYRILFSTLYFVLCAGSSFAQEKESTEIHKTKSSATIGGINYYLHTVEKGQTLFAIAKFYKIEVNDLVIENPEAIDGLKPGQVLKIPIQKKKIVKSEVVDTSNCIVHVVEKGQTLYSITKQYNVTDDVLKKLNPELLNGLKTGQKILIPSNKPKIESTPVVATTSTTTTTTNLKEGTIVTQNIQKIEAADRISASSIYKGEIKEEYNVAFFLPFHADEANAIEMESLLKGESQLPNKTNVALQFYEGALLAIDSLKKLKLNAKIFVFDVDDSDSVNMLTLLKKPELLAMDLIIGPLYGSSFMPVAKFAKENGIAIISPFTQVNKILFENPYVCKVSPSITLQIEKMATYVVDSFQTQNIVLVNGGGLAKDISFYNSFKKTANDLLVQRGALKADSIHEAKGLGGLQAMLSTTKVNVVVLPSSNQSFVTDFISKLYSMRDKYKIVLFGLQSWMNYDNLDFEYLNGTSLHIPSNHFIDYDNIVTQNFVKSYRDRFKTEPELYSFQGFDVTYFFLNALKQNGSGLLNNLTQLKYTGIESNYEFSQFPVDSGFENKHVFIVKYQDYKLVKAN
jgi:LysM repeat protein/ABC-type branched-subunit amino acid transport system substrate-binding protein